MATLIFVHGTSVRQADYEKSLKAIRTGLSAALAQAGHAPIEIEGCLWGNACGVRLNAGGKSVPEYDDRGGAGAPKPPNPDQAMLWEMLGYNSLFELYGLSLRDKKVPPKVNPGEFKGEVRKLPERVEPAAIQEAGISAEIFKAACDFVADEPVLSNALLRSNTKAECLMATARAVAAEALARAPAWPRPPAATDLNARDLFVNRIVNGFETKAVMGPLTWASNTLYGLAEPPGRPRLEELPLAGCCRRHAPHSQEEGQGHR